MQTPKSLQIDGPLEHDRTSGAGRISFNLLKQRLMATQYGNTDWSVSELRGALLAILDVHNRGAP
jgi:hypothetical protein